MTGSHQKITKTKLVLKNAYVRFSKAKDSLIIFWLIFSF